MSGVVKMQPMLSSNVHGSFYLRNGMFCFYGADENGDCVDVYTDDSCKKLIACKRGIRLGCPEMIDPYGRSEVLRILTESLIFDIDW